MKWMWSPLIEDDQIGDIANDKDENNCEIDSMLNERKEDTR